MSASEHRITWYVYTGGTNADGTREKIRRQASMRGSWPGYDVTCTCGWETKTGGAVRSYIEQEVWEHKWEHNALPTPKTTARATDAKAELDALLAEIG